MDTSRPYAYMNRAGAESGTLRWGMKTEKRGEGQWVRSGAGCYCEGEGWVVRRSGRLRRYREPAARRRVRGQAAGLYWLRTETAARLLRKGRCGGRMGNEVTAHFDTIRRAAWTGAARFLGGGSGSDFAEVEVPAWKASPLSRNRRGR